MSTLGSKEADVVVVGSGPGGATVAKEMSKGGKKVIICEAAGYHPAHVGYTLAMLPMLDKFGLTFSKEWTWLLRPKTAGGASTIYMATAARPPKWLKEKYGVDCEAEVDEFFKECPIKPLPDHLLEEGPRRIMDTAQKMGLNWNPLDKMIRGDKCKPGCGKCAIGCPVPGAKWTAREFLDEARSNGAELLLHTPVSKVLTENGKAIGVKARTKDGEIDIHAEKVVLSAGGQGTPPILQRSGVHDAGKGFFADPLVLVWANTPWKGTNRNIPMSAGVNLDEDGIFMTDIACPALLYLGLHGLKGPGSWLEGPKALLNYGNVYNIMIKTRDSLEGRVNVDESFSKPIDYRSWWQLDKGSSIAEEILMKMGLKRKDIKRTTVLAAHPGGTCRIGAGGILDTDCQTPIKNCYCSDTTIIPQDWGLPPVVTLVGMGKRLAKHLMGGKAKK